MITIESPPPQSSVTTVTIDLAQLPELSTYRRLALRFSLALMTRIEQQVTRERILHSRAEWLERFERERLAERQLLLTIPRR